MIVEYIRYSVDASRQDAFIDAYTEGAAPLLASEYCLSYELCRCEEDPSRFIVRLEWTSASDHMERFRASDEFRAFLAHVKPYIGDIDEMRHYTRLDARAG